MDGSSEVGANTIDRGSDGKAVKPNTIDKARAHKGKQREADGSSEVTATTIDRGSQGEAVKPNTIAKARAHKGKQREAQNVAV